MWFFMGVCAGVPDLGNLQHRALVPTIPCEQLSKEEAEHPKWKYCKTLYLSYPQQLRRAPACCFRHPQGQQPGSSVYRGWRGPGGCFSHYSTHSTHGGALSTDTGQFWRQLPTWRHTAASPQPSTRLPSDQWELVQVTTPSCWASLHGWHQCHRGTRVRCLLLMWESGP